MAPNILGAIAFLFINITVFWIIYFVLVQYFGKLTILLNDLLYSHKIVDFT